MHAKFLREGRGKHSREGNHIMKNIRQEGKEGGKGAERLALSTGVFIRLSSQNTLCLGNNKQKSTLLP